MLSKLKVYDNDLIGGYTTKGNPSHVNTSITSHTVPLGVWGELYRSTLRNLPIYNTAFLLHAR